MCARRKGWIQFRNIRVSKEIEYDFEEARDDDSQLSTLPSGLSIKMILTNNSMT